MPHTTYEAVRQRDEPGSESQEITPHNSRDGRPRTPKEAGVAVKAVDAPERNIGWMVPAAMIGFFLLAIIVAVVHYIYCRQLHNKFVESTIPQSWNNAFAIIFARVFSTALAASASAAFTQILWWYLRRRALTLSDIDALFSINCSPIHLYQIRLIKVTPLLWIFGLLIPLISIATIFPPGSLVVQQLPDIQSDIGMVPTLDVDYRGNNSAVDFFTYAMFDHGNDGEYRAPSSRYLNIGKRTLLEGSYLTRPSPCGANCTYTLTFAAPGLQCERDSPNLGLEGKMLNLYGNVSRSEYGTMPQWRGERANFLAAPYRTNVTDSEDRHTALYKFDLTYHDRATKSLKNTSCTTVDARYTANITYQNSVQKVMVDVVNGNALNATILSINSLFYNVIQSSDPTATNLTWDNSALRAFSDESLSNLYHGIQLCAIRDTLVNPLSGSISSFGSEDFFTVNTIIHETPLATSEYNKTSFRSPEVNFDLTPSTLEELMTNVTISILNDASNLTSTTITRTVYQSAYVFVDQARLIGAYAGTLAACLVFVLLGFGALWQNGTPSFSGGFMQIMCATTYGDSVMNQMAQEASVKGVESLPHDLSGLKVRFGMVTDGASAKQYTAFGTVNETETLLK